MAWARLEMQQAMNGERGCGFLFPLLIAMEKKSEKWASCKRKIEGIPLAAKALPSPLLLMVLLVGIGSKILLLVVVQAVGIGFYVSFLGSLLPGLSVISTVGKLRQRGAQIGGKCWTSKEELGWTNAWGSWVGGQGVHLVPRNAFAHAMRNKSLSS